MHKSLRKNVPKHHWTPKNGYQKCITAYGMAEANVWLKETANQIIVRINRRN